MANAKKIIKKIGFSLLAIVVAVLLVVVAYAVYLLVDYSRIDDNKTLAVKNKTAETVKVGTEYSILTYNIGFCAYLPDFGFFMDGGKESRAKSKESVLTTLDGINQLIGGLNPDFIMLEEVDEKATRSHKVNQREYFEKAYSQYNGVFATNYDSSYLFYPFNKPHGKSLAGMLTLSKYGITSSIRRSLPIENSLMKFFDLDRCYSVSRISVDGGKELVLYTVHLSAYTSDGSVATAQIDMLTKDMQKEYENGNYVVCGGDFNKDLLGNSEEIFKRKGEGQTWAQPFPLDYLKDKNLTLVSSLDEQNPIPTCRNADGPYNDKQFVLTVDGFIVSQNVAVKECGVKDGKFTYSDHNPVFMKFELI
ncbi:MAG: endonuclease/exonuclease/phosphatase family protein [Clostridiales bacterium]|nr:endonuclease/exonuclease/phosphatase family protein [Clostridiales bacterium]